MPNSDGATVYIDLLFWHGANFQVWVAIPSVLPDLHVRSHLRRKQLLTIPWLRKTGEPPDLPDPHPGPEGSALRGEYRRLLWDAVQNLSTPLKEVVTLHYYMQLPAVEIAVMLNCPEGTIYSRLHNARRRLAEMLTAQGITAPEMLEIQNAH